MRTRKRFIAFWLVCAFLYGYLAPGALAVVPAALSKKAEKVREGVARLGTGEQTRVAVKLRSGARMNGYISSATEDTFTISDVITGVHREVR
jgi:hypothetical protein